MEDQPIRFRDGASYDVMMGAWSRSVGEIFLDWMQPASSLEWVDVGCGSGAFTSLVVERSSPAKIVGIDPSESQLDFARARDLGSVARFENGDAMALPIGDCAFDVAVSALVVHFMPDPARGVVEMARVVKRGGIVASYAWDLSAGGFPYETVHAQMRARGLPPPHPPHPEAAEAAELRDLWTAAELDAIEQREIVVARTFQGFDDYWQTAITSPRIAAVLGRMSADALADLKDGVRNAMSARPDGTIVPTARANAIVGRVRR